MQEMRDTVFDVAERFHDDETRARLRNLSNNIQAKNDEFSEKIEKQKMQIESLINMQKETFDQMKMMNAQSSKLKESMAQGLKLHVNKEQSKAIRVHKQAPPSPTESLISVYSDPTQTSRQSPAPNANPPVRNQRNDEVDLVKIPTRRVIEKVQPIDTSLLEQYGLERVFLH